MQSNAVVSSHPSYMVTRSAASLNLHHARFLAQVRGVCRQIVSDYEARAKLWMSPAQNAEQYLRPLVTEFTSWMRCNKDILYQGSATEGLLRSIDERLRASLKNQVWEAHAVFRRQTRLLSVG